MSSPNLTQGTMNTRYQIFLSSTYSDLAAERKAIWEELTKTGFIVVGMEQFPASDEEQMEYIRPMIDDSDYYVLLIKGRYGTLSGDGLSYTEKEYRYAIEKEKPVLAFVYEDIGKLLVNETDQDPSKQTKLNAFRGHILNSRIVKLWGKSEQLVAEVLRSVHEIVRRKPAKGWIRGDNAADPKVYIELEDLRKQNAALIAKSQSDNANIELSSQFVHGRDILILSYSLKYKRQNNTDNKDEITGPFDYKTTWDGLLNDLVEILYRDPRERHVRESIGKIIHVRNKIDGEPELIPENDYVRQCRFQFQALGIINTFIREEDNNTWGGTVILGPQRSKHLCWELTPLGKRYIAQIRAKRREGPN